MINLVEYSIFDWLKRIVDILNKYLRMVWIVLLISLFNYFNLFSVLFFLILFLYRNVF